LPAQQIPPSLDARSALYRDRLAGTRTLILLDNAGSEAQVRPLLPGSAGCLVLVTSRTRLRALDDAHVLPLDLLPARDAVALLRAVAGLGDSEADDALLEQIADRCGRLPLALRIAAALLRRRPTWSVRHLADTLRASRPGLEVFRDGERDLTAVFDLSYRALTDEQRLLFRRLGLPPGPDADAYAAAALLESDPAGAQRLLQDLVDHNLLTEPVPGRYQMHDLIRQHARTLAEHDPADQRTAAMDRLLDYYQHTAGHADSRISRNTRFGPAGLSPAYTPAFPDPEQARAWLRAERANLEACLRHAATEAQDARIIALTGGLASLLSTEGPWQQAEELQAQAAAAADRLGDQHARARALSELGFAQFSTSNFLDAEHTLQQAVHLCRHLGDRLGEANALTDLGATRRFAGDRSSALPACEAALKLYLDLGDRLGQANALNGSGNMRRLTGDNAGAALDLRQALELYRALGHHSGQALALTQLGAVASTIGDYPDANSILQQALELCRDIGNRKGQAVALTYLGEVLSMTGDYSGATRHLQQALELYRDLGNLNGHAMALTNFGNVLRLAGDYSGATRHLQQAVGLFRQIGAGTNEVWALNCYAAVFTAAGDLTQALTQHNDALRMACELGIPDGQACALEGIGEIHLREGNADSGATHLRQALAIYRRLAQRHDIERVEARLTELSS
jgi:tetratricopeptide (TPR) repeat protein